MNAIRLADNDCLLPDWPAPANVKALLTTRRGGVSAGPYGACSEVHGPSHGGPHGGSHGSAHGAAPDRHRPGHRQGRSDDGGGLNLGLHTGDDAAAVAENRARLQARLDGRRIAWLDQCHGIDTVAAAEAVDGEPPRADAVVTDRADLACAIMVADCLPVLLCDRAGTAVGAAHAGWRGLCAGILEQAARRVAALAAGSPLMAYLGPAIGPTAFEVGAEVRQAFLDAASSAERDATDAAFAALQGGRGGQRKYLGDLGALARLRLARIGITDIWGGTLCTYSDPARFYSYRRDGRTGRQAALIWLEQAGQAR